LRLITGLAQARSIDERKGAGMNLTNVSPHHFQIGRSLRVLVVEDHLASSGQLPSVSSIMVSTHVCGLTSVTCRCGG